ncbi:MAG: hypothetical protein Q4C04_01770 [Clostridia bacterium]|nr:hypothetical protein [Clostridia bacterium]
MNVKRRRWKIIVVQMVVLAIMLTQITISQGDEHRTVVSAEIEIGKALSGDVTQDGRIAADDAAAILRYTVRIAEWDEAGKAYERGDCNFSWTKEDENGNWVIGRYEGEKWVASERDEDRRKAVNAADAAKILRYAVRLENTWYYTDHSYYMKDGQVVGEEQG